MSIRPRRAALACLAWMAVAATAAAWLQRGTVRDGLSWLAVFFYLMQPPLLALVCLAAGFVAFRFRRRRLLIVAAALCVTSGVHWLTFNFRRGVPAAQPGEVPAARVVLWNATGQRFADTALRKTILGHDPDLIVLVEAYTNLASRHAAQAAGYAVAFSPGTPSLVLLVRGEVLESRGWISAGGARLLETRVKLRDRVLRAMCVDIPSNPFRSRRAALEDVAVAVRSARPGESTLILGDFNTPPDLILLEPLRQLAHCAWESAGTGYRCTWPSVFPLLAIDQVWVTPGLSPRRCEMFTSLHSDHRGVVADIAVE